MVKLRSPIPWYGGKGNMIPKLVKYIPAHRIYVEPFGGGASLLFAKKPSSVEVYNDIDSDLVNLFRVLRDESKFMRFYDLVHMTPYSREEHAFCKETFDKCTDDVERAYKFYVIVKQGFNGKRENTWSYAVTMSRRGMSGRCSSWLSSIELLPEIHRRIMMIQIEHDHFREVIKRYDTEDTFFYCDPPYVHSTRRSNDDYKHEMTAEEHRELVDILLNIKGMAMVSGYRNEIYKTLEDNGWKRIDYDTICFSIRRTKATGFDGAGSAKSNNKARRTESIWICKKTQSALGLLFS